MSKQERRRVRVAASLGLTVLMSSAILGGVAPLTANAAEVGSEPTTTEVSPLITVPENPSDSVSSLPAGDDSGVEVVEETPDSAEAGMEEAPDVASEENADRELPTQSENIEADGGQTIEQVASTAESTEAILLDENDVMDGDWGDVHWTFEEGLLSLSGGTGADATGLSPWQSIASQVTKVEITGQIIAPRSIRSLFENFSAVRSIEGLSNVDTSKVTTMEATFRGTSSLESLDLSGWNVANVNDMESLFQNSGLLSLDLSTWQPAVGIHLWNTFSSMPRLEFLNISSWSSPYSLNLFGENVQTLKTIVLGMEARFTNLSAGSDFMWRGENTGGTFFNEYTGGNADIYHKVAVESEGKWGSVSWVVENNTLYLSGGEGTSLFGDAPWAPFTSKIDSVVIQDSILAPKNISGLFANLTLVTNYEGLEKLNVSKATDMSHMFKSNSRVNVLDISNWDTGNVTNMSFMFWYNSKVTAHDLSGWNTSNVKDMSFMFTSNDALTVLDLSEWDTGNVKNMNNMFYGCSNLSQLGIENWDVRSLANINFFLGATKLKSLDLSKWQFSGDNAFEAFSYMSELQTIDISGFDTNGKNNYHMLVSLPNLEEITLGNKSTLSMSLDEVPGKVWKGDVTGHELGRVYNGGYPDTYRLTEGTMAYYRVYFYDNQTGYYLGERYLYGQPGEKVSLSQMMLPAGYELPDPDATFQLPDNSADLPWADLELKRVVSTTTRTIEFQGLPEGHQTHEIQEIRWHWDWRQQETNSQNRSLRFYEDVVHLPQGGYDELIVPQVEGYKADIEVVPAKTFDGEITVLPADETFTVTYTKLDSGDGGNQNPDPGPSQPDPDDGSGSGGSNGNGSGNTGNGSTGTGSVGGGQLTNLSTGGSATTDQNQALPQTGSQVASGLTLLGLGLLGLLGFTKRRKRD